MAAAKPAEIQKLGESKHVRMALIAKSGFGKTVFSGTAPRALFLTTDPEGTTSAAGMGSTAEEWKITSWDELNKAYRWLRDGGVENYDWIIVDNITEAQRMAMQASIDAEMKKRPGRDEFVPEQADYQRSQNATIQMVLRFNDLPVNLIYTSHRKGMEDGDGNDYYSAAIQGQQGQVAEQILGYMNVIAFCETKEKDGKDVRRYYFTHTGPHRGKCRYILNGKSVLGNFKDDLTVPEMMELIEKAKAAARSGKLSARSSATKTATAHKVARKTSTATRRRVTAGK